MYRKYLSPKQLGDVYSRKVYVNDIDTPEDTIARYSKADPNIYNQFLEMTKEEMFRLILADVGQKGKG